jgi:hypothetical protein
MRQEADSISVRLAGKGDDYISAQSFLEVIKETLSILHELDAANDLVWKLKSASSNSPLVLTFVAEQHADAHLPPHRVSPLYLNLLRQLDRGGPVTSDVPQKAILRAEKLVNVLNNGVAKITYSAPGVEPFSPTQRVQASVAEIVEAKRDNYIDRATLEGDLRTVSVDGGAQFCIHDRATGQRTVCLIPHDDLDSAKAALERRVSVTGSVHYKSGKPTRIDVESFEIIQPGEDLPQFDDIRGIDLVHGEDSAELARRQFNG